MAARGHEIYKAEFLNVHAHIDKLLFRTWQLCQSAGTSLEGLVGDRLRLGPAHCDADAPSRSLPWSTEQHKDWTALVLELQIVCKESITGSKIFEIAFKDVQHSFMSLLLETLLSKFKNLTLLDNAEVKKCKNEFGRDALTKHNADIHGI